MFRILTCVILFSASQGIANQASFTPSEVCRNDTSLDEEEELDEPEEVDEDIIIEDEDDINDDEGVNN